MGLGTYPQQGSGNGYGIAGGTANSVAGSSGSSSYSYTPPSFLSNGSGYGGSGGQYNAPQGNTLDWQNPNYLPQAQQEANAWQQGQYYQGQANNLQAGYNSDYAYNQAVYDQQLAALQRAQGGSGASAGLALQQNALSQQGNVLDTTNATTQRGLLDQAYANNTGYNTQQQGFLGQGLTLDQTTAQQLQGQQRRALMSDAGARGDFGGQGYQQQMGDIANQYNNSLAKYQLGYDSSLAGLANQRSNLDTSYQSGVSNSTTNLGKLDLAAQGLKLAAKQIGMSAGNAQRAYDDQIARMGLDKQHTDTQLLNMFNSNSATLQNQAQQFLSQTLQASMLQGFLPFNG